MDQLVFDASFDPLSVDALPLSKIAYWYERGVALHKRRKGRS